MAHLKALPTTLIITFFILLISICFTGVALTSNDDSRSIKVKLKTNTGAEESVALYKGSYALLIGVSGYNAGWSTLESIPSEINQVDSLLKERGFHVTKIIDPDSRQLESSFENFINSYGLEKENRLLFFFSGHGYTRKDGKKGYLVPIDAPDPNHNMTGFLQKALGMNQVVSWARDIEAKHALFLFDSCFSGTIFKQKSRPVPPRHITRLTIEPVRQFITAGSAGEEVPASSTFTPAFIDALRYGFADLNRDGYVSATELGLYLQAEVPEHADQNPQFGKIRDYELSRGDFIFMTNDTFADAKITPWTADKPKEKTPYISTDKLGILQVKSIPEGAAVYIEENFHGSTPLTLSDIAPGTHSLRVEKEGYMTQSKQIQVSSGKMVSIEFPLVDITAGGTLTIVTIPQDASVNITGFNGFYSTGMRLPASEYELKISKNGYITEKIAIQLADNEDLHLNVTLKTESGSAVVIEQQYQRVEKPVSLPTISATNKKILYSRQSQVPEYISNYINSIRSTNSKVVHKTAKTIYKNKTKHPALMKVIEQELLAGYKTNMRDKNHIDTMAWFCNILGSTKQSQYKATLKKVANSKTNKKLRKYAKKNLRHLR